MSDIHWTLPAALTLIRDLQPVVFAEDFYLALAGGVLNRGESRNDLDLVAVANSPTSKAEDLQKCLEEFFMFPVTRVKIVNGRVHLKWANFGIEILVIEKDSRS